MSQRTAVLRTLALAIPPSAGHPVRVAVDGMTGVGKTHLRSELAELLRAEGRTVLEASGDDFHHQRERRWAQGRHSSRGYYEDAYDYAALADKVLRPLGPGGDRRIVLKHHDLESDALLAPEPITVPADAVVVVDGSFLLRPEVSDLWEVHILITASRAASIARQQARDGSPADVADPYYARYFGAYDIYVAERSPGARADVTVDNSAFHAPVAVSRSLKP